VYIGAGGSAFNDLGIGALNVLGLNFYDAYGNCLEASLKELRKATSARWADDRKDILSELKITFACDVTNPLLGPRGCTYVFGPQKGVKPEDLEEIDGLLGYLIEFMKTASEIE